MSAHSHSHAAHDHDGPGHVLPFKVYLSVFIALLILTVITVGAAYVDFGVLNMVIAMLIASTKAGIVALFFMHLKYEDPMTWLYAFFPILLLATLIGGVFIDNPLRATPQMVEVVDPLKGGVKAEAPQGALEPQSPMVAGH